MEYVVNIIMGHIVIENLDKAFGNHHRSGRVSSGGNRAKIVLKGLRKVFVEKDVGNVLLKMVNT